MPATSARQITKQNTQKPRASAPTKKRRVVRRRGRARGELDSDDEIEREPATDGSDSEDDDSDSLDSATDDSETEPVSEEAIPHDRAHLPTPRNSKSPESVGKGGASPFFAPTGSWSEMVMDETLNGSAELPVVDFADFGAPPLPKSNKATRKPKKSPKTNSFPDTRAPPVELMEQPPTPPPADPVPTTPPATESKRPPHYRRQTLPGHSARQLYQQKLDSDPSFVPTIGNFWSHDDRLIETELRNLSGWWRGRGRGGRGDYNIRGRGGFVGRGKYDDNSTIEEEELPVDKPWTHDGFEEMKKKDEQRRGEQGVVRQAQSSPKRGGFVGRGRGNFMQGRGRGGYSRGGFSSPVRSRNGSPFAFGNRVRFAMKPELMWTKQHEAFLYFDSTLKPRPGQAPVFRVRLPGQQLQVIRVSSSVSMAPKFSSKTITAGQTENYVVRLPRHVQEEKGVTIDRADETSKDTSIVNQDVSAEAGPGPNSLATDSTASAPLEVVEPSQSEVVSLGSTSPEPEQQPTNEETIPPPDMSANDPPDTSPVHERPVLPPLQTTFTPPPPPPQPVSQPSPAYGSPFPYAMPLPPGIAMSANGVPYELATGRPVYLQPPTMYTPRPMIHSHYLHPGHMHHHSLSNASPDFLAHPASHTPPVNGFIDPATGTPIFAFPRQTSRIEIRAPGDSPSTATAKLTPKVSPPVTSTLRSSSASFQPASTRLNAEPSDNSGYYLPSSTPSDTPLPSYEPQVSTTEDPAAASMVQQYYPQQYYYPEPYGYSQYMDMSHAGQTYQMYGMEQVPQGTVYY